jgi:two-component system, OmpR family, phosphate regulon sensor histidine kinase PhoR
MTRHTRSRFLGVVWFILVLVFVSGMIAIAFFLTAYVYKITNWHLPVVLIQIINTLVGLLFTGTMIGIVSKIARSRGWIPEMNVFGSIVDALERIARGDFSVRVADEFQDNTMFSKLTESVNKMASELDQMENMRQEFISNVSHEIQSPLTSIRGFAQALENDQLSADERHHYLDIIQKESTRLSRITEDLLRMAALESDKVKFEPKSYRLDHQIRNLILACEPQWRDKDINVEVSLEELEITADEDLLSQVWINLIHNSIKFTPQAGRIAITLQKEDSTIQFEIKDSGIGISGEDQAHIFERFYKADTSRTRSGSSGSGLGLAIVRKIVELHSGTVTVESAVGTGTSFKVSLPV